MRNPRLIQGSFYRNHLAMKQALEAAEARATLAEQARIEAEQALATEETARAAAETARAAAETARATAETARAAAEQGRAAAEQALAAERIQTDFLLADAIHILIREGRFVDAVALFSRIPQPHLYPRTLKTFFCMQVANGAARRHLHAKRAAGRHRDQRPPRH